MASKPQVRAFELEIWGAIEDFVAARGYQEPIIDATGWSGTDLLAYQAALQNVRLIIEQKAGHGPDPTDPGRESWAKRYRR